MPLTPKLFLLVGLHLHVVSLTDGLSVVAPTTVPTSPMHVMPFLRNHRCGLVSGGSFKKSTSLFASSAATISSNEDLLPGIAAIDASNPSLYQMLESMRTKPYFRLYSVDILASCEYLPQELFECYSETCEIYPVDEDEVSCAVGVTSNSSCELVLTCMDR